MANIISCATGNFTSSSTFKAVDATSELDAENGVTGVSTSAQDSASFVPGAITTEGVALKLSARVSTTGTLTVTLRNVTDSTDTATVTVNAADLPALNANYDGNQSCWVFFNWGTATLTVAKSYCIRLTASSNNSSQWYRNSTGANWARKLRTTTNQAPAANNHIIVTNELTGAGTSNAFIVTYDNTAATTWGPSTVGTTSTGQGAFFVCNNAVLTWGNTASTNYVMQLRGVLYIVGGGIMQNGTNAARCLASVTQTIQFDCANNNDSRIRVDQGGLWNVYGAAKNWHTRLTVDASSSATSFTCSDTTGWASGDIVAFSPTGTSRTEYESRTLNSVGSSTTFGISSGTTYAHKGTSPLQAYVLNLTRSVKMKSLSTSLRGSLYVQGSVHIEYLEIDGSTIGTNSSTGYPINIQHDYTTGTTQVISGVTNNPSTSGVGSNIPFINIGTSINGCTIDNNVSYDWASWFVYVNRGGAMSAQANNWFITSNISLKQTDGNESFLMNNVSGWNNTGNAFCNNVSISHAGGGNAFNFNMAGGPNPPYISAASFDGNECWYSDNVGFNLQMAANVGGFNAGFTFACQNCKTIRNAQAGWATANGQFTSVSFKNLESFGNAGGTGNADIRMTGANVPWLLNLDGCSLSADSSFASGYGILVQNNGGGITQIRMNNTTIGKASGIKTAYATGNIATTAPASGQTLFSIIANSCYFGGSGYTNGGVHGVLGILDDFQRAAGDHINNGASYLRCQDYNQTPGDHRTFVAQGTISIDQTVYNTAAPSQKLTPNSATFKLRSGPQRCGVTASANRTISVYVRKSKASTGDSADYNGNQPRLIVRRNDPVGVTTDTVLATASTAIGTWEQISGSISSPLEDGAVEFYVDCDGTTGFVSVDDYTAS